MRTRWDMVNVLAEPGGALDAAIELAEKIAATGRWRWPPPSRSSSSPAAGTRDFFAEQDKISARCSSSNDAKEGAIAFAEKRAPQWTGTELRRPDLRPVRRRHCPRR